jgi:hypothetical protein
VLDPEQEQLLADLVEASRSVPRSELQDFLLIRLGHGDMIHGPVGRSLESTQLYNDVVLLADAGLVRISRHGSGSDFSFFVIPEGFEHYRQTKQRAGEAAEQVEQELNRSLDSDHFRSSYQGVYELWSDAASLLWGADSKKELTTIGHKCREAVQEFATALVMRHQPPDVDDAPTHTAARSKRL